MSKKEDTKAQVTQSQSFSGTIRKGGVEPRLVIKAVRFYLNSLMKFKDGEQVTVVITNKKPKRSEQQNNYYWGVYLPLIAEETGEQNIENLHELFKGMFLTTGIVEVLGKQVRIKKSTANLGVGEFCNYILAIQEETGVEPPPTENYLDFSLREGLQKYEKKINEKAGKRVK